MFRLVRNDPPSPEDFLSKKLEEPEQNWGHKECEACGLSVYNSYKRADKTKRTYKKKFDLHMIAKGNITTKSGVVAKSFSNGHFTWWVYPGIEAHATFNIKDGE